jgi:hypothetical protein
MQDDVARLRKFNSRCTRAGIEVDRLLAVAGRKCCLQTGEPTLLNAVIRTGVLLYREYSCRIAELGKE